MQRIQQTGAQELSSYQTKQPEKQKKVQAGKLKGNLRRRKKAYEHEMWSSYNATRSRCENRRAGEQLVQENGAEQVKHRRAIESIKEAGNQNKGREVKQ